jgi:hypothetical protein
MPRSSFQGVSLARFQAQRTSGGTVCALQLMLHFGVT